MAKKKPTKEESEHISHVCSFGCMVCGGMAEPHHPRSFTTLGMGQKASNWLVIPLCREHHTEVHQRMAAGGKSEHDLLADTVKALTSYPGGFW